MNTGECSAEVKLVNLVISDSIETRETQRLEALIPFELRSRLVITQAARVNPALVATEIGKRQFAIGIDFIRWQQLSVNQRDLLFWHEVSRIQNKNIIRFPWEMVVMGTGLSVSLIEVVSQNVLSLSFALVATVLAGHQLYQRHRGERSLREATAADRGAINLAVQSGYSFAKACSSLQDALKFLTRQPSQKSLWKKYQVRLRALEIFVEKDRKPSQRAALELETTEAGIEIQNLVSDT